MDVAYNCDRCTNVNDIWLTHQHFLCFLTYFSKKSLVQELFVQQLFNTSIEVERSHIKVEDVYYKSGLLVVRVHVSIS